jgi:nitroreductase
MKKEGFMFDELIEKRRSIRRFKADPVQPRQIEKLAEAALRAPSSRGLNPWEFVFVTDRGMLERLATAKPHGASFLAGAALGVVVCGNPQVSDVWVEDTAIASIFLHLAAASLGLGSCWIQIRKRKHSDDVSAESFVAELLQIPVHLRVESIIAVGQPAESKPAHPRESLQREKIHLQRHGQSFDPENAGKK